MKSWLALVLCTICCAGCMGGGTIGTGIDQGFASGGGAHTFRFAIRGQVRDAAGKPIGGLRVSMETAQGFRTSQTNATGRFESIASIQSGEEIRFTFQSPRLHAETSAQISPQGSDTVEVDFTVAADGRIEVESHPL